MTRILVLGAGESGRGVARLAKQLGHQVFVSDAGKLSPEAKTELDSLGIPYEEGGHGDQVLTQVDLVVKSPGIPWTSTVAAAAKTSGIPIMGEMEFCAPHVKGRVIGITGSNGKTTTTLLLGHLLQEAGVDVGVGGNVGKSFARMIAEDGIEGKAWYVLELSSFQLEDIRNFHVNIGMVLNLSADHLDRYETGMAGYAAAKYRLKDTQSEGSTWLQAGDHSSLQYASRLGHRVQEILMPSSYETGKAKTPRREYDLSETVLTGPHNAANASFALTAAELVGVQAQVLAEALKTFRNAPHRLESVGIVDGVVYVNDSKATNQDAADKALRSFQQPIVWLVGGEDKGNDYSLLEPLVHARVRAVVAMGVDNSKIAKTFGNYPGGFASTSNIQDALNAAQKFALPGDVVLLSPACASFDLFLNYIDRGDQFRHLVQVMPGFSETL